MRIRGWFALMAMFARAFGLVLIACALLSVPAAGARERAPIPDVVVGELPPEARRTLELIKKGGPFPHRNDDRTFGNRERRLPLRERGYYREYTVPTPGARDRGARRIVTGRNAEYYYTDDHYETFRRIRE